MQFQGLSEAKIRLGCRASATGPYRKSRQVKVRAANSKKTHCNDVKFWWVMMMWWWGLGFMHWQSDA